MRFHCRAFFMVVICTATFCYGVDLAEVSQVSDQPAELRTLMESRRDVLKDRLTIIRERSTQGVEPKNNLMMAIQDLLGAELELARTKPERIAILEQMLKIAIELEEMTKVQKRVGISDPLEELEVRAFRLEREIGLLREKSQ